MVSLFNLVLIRRAHEYFPLFSEGWARVRLGEPYGPELIRIRTVNELIRTWLQAPEETRRQPVLTAPSLMAELLDPVAAWPTAVLRRDALSGTVQLRAPHLPLPDLTVQLTPSCFDLGSPAREFVHRALVA